MASRAEEANVDPTVGPDSYPGIVYGPVPLRVAVQPCANNINGYNNLNAAEYHMS